MKLLIADDENIITEGLKRLDWEEAGITKLLFAGNGMAALKLLSCEKPDILLTDVEMPNISGLELARIIKQDGLPTKIIILSGHDEFRYAQEAIKYDVCEYLLKPCSSREILECVKRVADHIKLHNADDNLAVLRDTRKTFSSEGEIITAVFHYLEKNYMFEVSLTGLSEALNYSASYLSKLIKEKTNYTFLKLLTLLRMQKAAELLAATDLKVYVICDRIGMTDQRYFSQVFRKTFGVTPLEYRRINKDCKITSFVELISNREMDGEWEI